MQLDISAHAVRRLAERGITEVDLEQALTHLLPGVQPGEPGTVWLRGYAAGGRILKMCVDAADRSRIITAAWPNG